MQLDGNLRRQGMSSNLKSKESTNLLSTFPHADSCVVQEGLGTNLLVLWMSLSRFGEYGERFIS